MDPQVHEYRALLLARLTEQPAQLAHLIATRPGEAWHQRQLPDGATLHQIAAHVRDAEALAFWPRVQRIYAEAYPHLDAFPYHRYSVEEAYRPEEPLIAIATAFAETRAEALALMHTLNDADWSRTGFHPPSGPRTLQWWAERMYNHARGHLDALQTALSNEP